jgi:hypothetical protein
MGAPHDLVYEYTPVPVGPLGVALLLLFAIVTVTFAPIALTSDIPGVRYVWILPLVLVAAGVLAAKPSPTRIYTDGIEIALPLWRRLLGGRRWYPFADLLNVYPATYEVSGAAMSPFASSAGTLVHRGLGLETRDGHRVVVRFTPGVIRTFRGESEGFRYAMDWLRRLFREAGRHLVQEVPAYSDDAIRAMEDEARRPLLDMGTIVVAFFSPPSLLAVALWLLFRFEVAIDAVLAALLAVLTLAPPVASMAVTWRRSRERNTLLGELAKYQEYLRERREARDDPSG